MVLVILLALIATPILEIAVFIEVGERIGLWSTLGLVVLTAVIGTALLRQQGLATLASARTTIERGGMPVQEVLDGICLLIAGAFLLTPGFITDGFGAALLLPPLRRVIQRWGIKRLMARGTINVAMHGAGRRHGGEDGVIDGEFVELDDDDEPRDRLPPSGSG
jgi:UPF0716 protein FxsA